MATTFKALTAAQPASLMRAARVDAVGRHYASDFCPLGREAHLGAAPHRERRGSALTDAEIALACTRSAMVAAALRMASWRRYCHGHLDANSEALSAAGTITNNRREAVGAIRNPFVAPLKSTLSLPPIRDIKHET